MTWANGYLYQLDRGTGTVYEIDSTTGDTVSQFQGPAGDLWDIVTTDGVTFWALEHSNDEILRFDRAGVVLDAISVPDSYLTGITSDGDSLWILDRFAETVTQVHPNTGLIGVSFVAPGSGGSLDGLVFDGHNFWANRWLDPWSSSSSVVNQNRTYKFDRTGQELLSFVTPFARDHQALSLAHDGDCLWIGQDLDELLLKVTIETGAQEIVFDGANRSPESILARSSLVPSLVWSLTIAIVMVSKTAMNRGYNKGVCIWIRTRTARLSSGRTRPSLMPWATTRLIRSHLVTTSPRPWFRSPVGWSPLP